MEDNLLDQRVIFLDRELDSKFATKFCSKLLWLDSLSSEEIVIYINSPGGNIVSGLFPIYNVMQSISSPIKTIVFGEAYSGAALILAAGTRGSRFAFDTASIMIHDVQMPEISGPVKFFRSETKQALKEGRKMKVLLSKHTKKSLKEINFVCQQDTYLTPYQALRFGIIDKIIKKN